MYMRAILYNTILYVDAAALKDNIFVTFASQLTS